MGDSHFPGSQPHFSVEVNPFHSRSPHVQGAKHTWSQEIIYPGVFPSRGRDPTEALRRWQGQVSHKLGRLEDVHVQRRAIGQGQMDRGTQVASDGHQETKVWAHPASITETLSEGLSRSGPQVAHL